MTEADEFPTELPADDDDAAATLRWTASVIAGTAALLALFNANAITGWSEDLPPGPATLKLVEIANGWDAATASAGLGAGHARLHKAWTRLERARWSQRVEVDVAER
jgi:hypothetical protein